MSIDVRAEGEQGAPGVGEPGRDAVSGEGARGEEQPLASRAKAVTLFEDRAEVIRVARAQLTKGTQRLRIGGVSMFVDDRVVEARTDGPCRITAVRVRRVVHGDRVMGREEIEALEREAEAARARVRAADLALDRAARLETQASQLAWQWAQEIASAPRGIRKPEVLERWKLALDRVDAAAAEARAAAADARSEHVRAEDERRRATERLAEGRQERPRAEAWIEVELEASAPAEVTVELTYRVACALWRPEHLARLEGNRVTLSTWATAWQATGERWEDVTARFSTARPARVANPPRLTDDVLSLRRKTPEERSRVVVEAREQTIATAGLERGARAVDEMPGVDDGGEPLVLEASHPITLPSSGQPIRVEVARRSLAAEVELVLYPEVHAGAHLRATLTNSAGEGSAAGRDGASAGGASGERLAEAPTPLLAGPVRVARGQSLVGRGKLGFIGLGEPFELGFGTEDALRVRRAVDEERDTAFLGGVRIRRKVTVYLSNLSSTPRRLLVLERIPVSEVAEVEIALSDAAGWSVDKDGFVRGRFELGANEARAVSFGYEIKASSGTVLPF
ncbi:DUF4139 domain-containing protein [Chondromyces crocatus]|uniref:DUF4139 domain-containing protein n=1 Tax=Chondromyces crocatus TaxID=52 RepID=A0A0K1EPJ2_CHOCO|nr:DUF4139 domain-containing protein [Chondromyces crocatus]AKT42840.1 uncharacterized protein CMC5_070680 [Chondromyces crocatus]